MNIKLVKVAVKFSKEIGYNCWKTVELGAEADVDPEEDSWEAQRSLTLDLWAELDAGWDKGPSPSQPSQAQPSEEQSPFDGAEGAPEADKAPKPTPKSSGRPAPPPEAQQRHCVEHKVDFSRKVKGQDVWWSHKLADGSWCNEPKQR